MNNTTLPHIEEILKVLDIDFFPTREEIKKYFNQKIKTLHPDINNDPLAHQKTIELFSIYQNFIKHYSYYEQEYLNKFLKTNSSDTLQNDDKVLIYQFNSYYLGLPLQGLINFLHKNEFILLQKNDNFYISYNSNIYKIINTQECKEKLKNNEYYSIALYDKNELFAYCIKDKIKYIDTIEKKELQVSKENPIFYKFNNLYIYIPDYFKNWII